MMEEICLRAMSAPKSEARKLDIAAWTTNLHGYGNGRGVLRMDWKIAAVVLAAALSGCSTADVAGSGPSAQAFAQGQAGRPVAAAIVDAMAGGLVGGTLGTGLDTRERRRALEAEYRALDYTPAGQAVPWGQAGGRRGEVVAGSPYRVGSQDCRQYAHTVHIGGQAQTARGAACRNSDGSWTPLA